MKFKILVISNRISSEVETSDDLQKFKEYVEERTPLEVEYSYETSDFDLTHKSFGIKLNNATMWGLDGVKDKVREMGVTPIYLYHAVFFLYNLEDTKFKPTPPKRLGHWTYFQEIVPGTEFVEIATKPAWDKGDDIFRVLTHEIFHVWHNRIRRRGVATKDTMDEYDKEFEPLAEDGNRARNLKALSPYWPIVAAQPVLQKYINALLAIIASLMARITELT